MFCWNIIILINIIQIVWLVRGYEYCSKEAKLCRGKEKRHIICFKEQIKPDSLYEKHYPMTDRFREWILYWHNYFRNEVACGKVQGIEGLLPQATKMRELAWDYELEYIARIHAGRCKLQHDQCRNTERIPWSGQNLAYYKTTGPPRKALDNAQISIHNWFKESKDVSEAIIKDYKKLEGPQIGHFTVLANDRVGRVGCAMTSCNSFPGENEKWTFAFLTCNYDYTNIVETPVYKAGSALSDCKSFGVGKSSNFTCLCEKSY